MTIALRAAALALALVCSLPAAAGAEDPLRVSAPPALVPIMRRIADAFASRYGRDVEVTARSSRDGIAGLRAGQIDVALADSPAGEEGLRETTIAYAPLALVADPSIGITSLRRVDARGILNGTIASWAALGGRDVAIARFDHPAGGAIDRVLSGGLDVAAKRPRGTIDLSSAAVVRDVKMTAGGVGVVVLPYAGDLSGVRILAIDDQAPDVEGARKGYPLLGAELAVTLGTPTLASSRFVAYLATSSDFWRANALIPVRDLAAH